MSTAAAVGRRHHNLTLAALVLLNQQPDRVPLQGFGGSIFALSFAIARDEMPSARRSLGFGLISGSYGAAASPAI